VKSFPEAPTMPVDQLGDVNVDCAQTKSCTRALLDEVCARGGDVLWGYAEHGVSSLKMAGHAAHTQHASYAPRAAGCDVKVYPQTAPGKTEDIGVVSAKCPLDTPDAACMRELQDQACMLGADVVWGVDPPIERDGRKKLTGRAAHTKP
jgi:hypothetical protein